MSTFSFWLSFRLASLHEHCYSTQRANMNVLPRRRVAEHTATATHLPTAQYRYMNPL